MQPKQVTYLLCPILSHLWLFSPQGLPVFKALEGFLTQCPVCTWTYVDVLHPTKPLGDEFPSPGASRTTSFKSNKHLVMPPTSYSFTRKPPFLKIPWNHPRNCISSFPDMRWDKALLNSQKEFFPLVSGEVSFSLQEANTCKNHARNTSPSQSLKGIFKSTNLSSWDGFANCGAAWILWTGKLDVTPTCKSRKKLTE